MAATKAKKTDNASNKIAYHKLKITCACGAEFEAGSTLENIRVDVCSQCHPFYTGENRVLDSEGRIEKFRKKYNLAKK